MAESVCKHTLPHTKDIVSHDLPPTTTALVLAASTPISPVVERLTNLSFEEFQELVFSICQNPDSYSTWLIDTLLNAFKNRITAATSYRDRARKYDDLQKDLAVRLSNGNLDMRNKIAVRRELNELGEEDYAAWDRYYQRTLRKHQRLLQILYIYLSQHNTPEDDEEIGITPREPLSDTKEMKAWLEQRRKNREVLLRQKYQPDFTIEDLERIEQNRKPQQNPHNMNRC